MGFGDFRDFNLAMLGKQGWRFVTHPGSFVSQVFKARYFPKRDFLPTAIGDNPSYVWRSVWEAKDLIKSGASWLIGTGEHINIENQPWLNEDSNPYITTVSPSIIQQKVASLFCNDRKEWDIEVLRDIFNDRDQQCVY